MQTVKQVYPIPECLWFSLSKVYFTLRTFSTTFLNVKIENSKKESESYDRFNSILSSLISFSLKVKNLQDKWRDQFDFLDVNGDSLLDMVDVNLSKDNYVRIHNLTEAEVCGYCKMIHM